MIRTIVTIILVSLISINSYAQMCTPPNPNQNLIRLCNNVDDVICKDVPAKDRRSCEESDRYVFKKDMTTSELYNFAKGCFQTSVTSFTQFFTDFIPELIKGIWNATVSATDGSLWDKLHGEWESTRAFFADINEAIRENPSAYFAHIWQKIIDSVSENIEGFDCLKPQLKVERTCAFVSGWLMPPAVLGTFLVKGFKAIKHVDIKAGAKQLQLALTKAEKKPALTLKAEKSLAHVAATEINNYKSLYSKEPKLPSNSNSLFINSMKADRAITKHIIYFDVENSVQKKLNDVVFKDKSLVDAVNNSFMTKFQDNLNASPELKSRLVGQYKDYKSMRLKLVLKDGDDKAHFQKLLSNLQNKTSMDFVTEFEKLGMNKAIPPMTSEVVDVKRWFLAGTGDTALEANMAARGARANTTSQVVNFKNQLNILNKDINEIEFYRKNLESRQALLKSGIMAKTNDGIIPSKEIIEILRKNKPDDFSTSAEYVAKIKGRVKALFGKEIDDQTVSDLTNYFQKVDSLSPPLFASERTIINLGEANRGIVSVDFAGAGVNNAFEQMRALSSTSLKQTDKTVVVNEALTKLKSRTDGVTDQMNQGKKTFDQAIKDVSKESHPTLFSGDDGIFIPKSEFVLKDKEDLIKALGTKENPSQYRVTFVRSEYEGGKVIPAKDRGKLIARAESIEKALRERVVGVGKLPIEKSKQMIFGIDFVPKESGGTFNLLIGGAKPTKEELKRIEESFKQILNSDANEVMGIMRS